ncbi:uncharacterized protein VTP21DRAFT_3652 [Calcarisporiella thermophila]|uniref:uncharacterized protein n=1 Tax=Calcarisporiella thermophila TaxID=911321 RepID=UPI00374491DC
MACLYELYTPHHHYHLPQPAILSPTLTYRYSVPSPRLYESYYAGPAHIEPNLYIQRRPSQQAKRRTFLKPAYSPRLGQTYFLELAQPSYRHPYQDGPVYRHGSPHGRSSPVRFAQDSPRFNPSFNMAFQQKDEIPQETQRHPVFHPSEESSQPQQQPLAEAETQGQPLDAAAVQKLEELSKIADEFADLRSHHGPRVLAQRLVFDPANFGSSPTPRDPQNRPFLEYEELLTRLMLRVDGIDADGVEEVRKRRKDLVRRIDSNLSELDRLKERWLNGQKDEAAAHT